MSTEKPQELVLLDSTCPAESKEPRDEMVAQQARLRRQLRETDKRCGEKNKSRQPATIEAAETGLEDSQCAMKAIRHGAGYVGISALEVSRILPLELFAQSSELAWVNGLPFPIIEHYRRQWLVLTGTLANLTVPLEILYVKLFRQIARLRHGRDRREVEEEIAETYRTYTSVE